MMLVATHFIFEGVGGGRALANGLKLNFLNGPNLPTSPQISNGPPLRSAKTQLYRFDGQVDDATWQSSAANVAQSLSMVFYALSCVD